MAKELDDLIKLFREDVEATKEGRKKKKEQFDKTIKRVTVFMASFVVLIWAWILTEILSNIIGWF